MADLSRRDLVGTLAGIVAFRDDTLRLLANLTSESSPDPQDEAYWGKVRELFNIHPTLAVFNHVGVNPPPRTVEEALYRESKRASTDPSYVMWRQQDRELDSVVKDLAEIIGCSPVELALVPNATYGLQTVICGVPMSEGDEIVLPSEEYPRSFTAAEQRERRDKTKTITVDLEGKVLSDDEIVRRFLSVVTDRTRLVVVSEITYLLGRRMPVTRLVDELGKRGIPVLSDVAQSIGLLEKHASTNMTAACLHKWIMGPVGTGILMVKSDWISKVWPLHPADDTLKQDIEKFRQIGTHSTAPYLALKESLELHHRLGAKAKSERLQYLRETIVKELEGAPKLKILNSLNPEVCMPFLTLQLEGKPSTELANQLMRDHQVHVTTAVRADVNGIRISPNIFTNMSEVDRLVTGIRSIANKKS